MTLKIIYLTLITISLSCGSKKSELDKKIFDSPKINLDSLNKQKSIQLSQANNATINWNDSNYYSYRVQESLKGKTISLTGYVKDIIKKGENYMLTVYATGKGSYLANLIIDSSQLRIIGKKNVKSFLKGCFVFKVDNVMPVISANSKASGYFIGDPEDEGTYDEVEVDITYEFGTVIKLSGILIDYYLFQKHNDE